MTIPIEKKNNDAFAYLLSSQFPDAKLVRIATLADFQIGTPESPSELQITGRFSQSITTVKAKPNEKIVFPFNYTILCVTVESIEEKSNVVIELPNSPRLGQLCYVKDESGTADICNIIIQDKSKNIDIIDFKNGCVGFFWTGSNWSTMASSGASTIIEKTTIEKTTETINTVSVSGGGGGTGDVVGPASSTTDAVAKFADTSGKLLSNTSVTIDSSNNVTIPGRITVTGGTTTYTDATLGNAAVGSFPYYDGGVNSGVYAMIGHKDLDHSTTVTNYALFQDNTGNTAINASNDKSLILSVNNTIMGFLTNNLLGTGIDAISLTGESSTKTNVALGNTTLDSSTSIYAGTGDLNIGENAASRTVNLGTGNNTTEQEVTIGSTFGRSPLILRAGTSKMFLTGAISTDFIIGHTAGTGDIIVGRSTASNTINVGNSGNNESNTQTVNIAAGTGRSTVTIGSSAGASSTSIKAGSGGITLSGSGGQTVITGSSTTYTDALIGAWEVGSLPATQGAFPNAYAFVGHKDLNHGVDGNYALVQSSAGDTFLGAVATKGIYFKNGTSFVGQLLSSSVSFTGASATNVSTVLGSPTGSSSTRIDSGTGNIDIGATNSSRVISIGTGTSPQTISIGTAAANTITVGNSAATTTTVSGGSALNLYSNGGTVTIDSAGNGGIVNIDSFGYNGTVNVGTGGNSAVKTVTVGSAYLASATTIEAGTGNIDIGVSNSSRTINIGPTGNAGGTLKILPGTGIHQVEFALSSSFYNRVRIADGTSSTGHEVYINTGNDGGITNPITTASPGGYAVTKIGTLNDESRVTIGGVSGSSFTSIRAGSGGITLSGSGGQTVITGSSTSYTDALIGAWEIGSLPATQGVFPNAYAFVGHKDLNHGVDGNYALVQSNVGDTFLGTVSGKDIYFKNGTDFVGQINSTSVSFTGKSGVATTATLGSVTGSSATNVYAGTGGVFVTGSTTISAGLFNYPTGSSTTCPLVLLTNEGATVHRWAMGTDTGDDLNFAYGANSTTVLVKGYIENTTNVGSIDFTGQHRNFPASGSINDYSSSVGLIVIAAGQYKNLVSGSSDIFINEALPTVALSNSRNQKSVFGVISDSEDANEISRYYSTGRWISVYEKSPNDDRLIINSLGEGAVWVCNINGALENGDYITSCEIPGYGMKQDDDILHNYTVAKITCDCDFNLSSSLYKCEEFIHEGVTYRRAFVGCTYHCG